MDNYAAHKRAEVRDWLEANPRVQVHFTPTSASWMNLVEVWFGSPCDTEWRIPSANVGKPGSVRLISSPRSLAKSSTSATISAQLFAFRLCSTLQA